METLWQIIFIFWGLSGFPALLAGEGWNDIHFIFNHKIEYDCYSINLGGEISKTKLEGKCLPK